MRKISVYLPAYGGCTVKLEVPDDMSDEDIKETAYAEASLTDGELYDWDYETDVEINEDK